MYMEDSPFIHFEFDQRKKEIHITSIHTYTNYGDLKIEFFEIDLVK